MIFQVIKQKTLNNTELSAVVFLLLSILLPIFVVNLSLLLLLIISFRYKKKFEINITFILPILLYLLMVLSLIWSVDFDRTINSLSKELPLILIPICFLFIKKFSNIDKNKILKFYSFGIVFFSIYYIINAFYRYSLTKNIEVFYYHELVTKVINAIHVSVYVAIAFFYFFTKPIKKILDYFIMSFLFLMIVLLSSKSIIIVLIGLIILYNLFYTKLSKQMRLKNIILVGLILISFTFIGKIKERFKQEYETIMTDSTVNDVISKNNEIVYNVSIKQAWTNKVFQANDYFPGIAFRVYQFRIFLEMLKENNIFWQGLGLDASYKKIEAKGIYYHLYLGNDSNDNQGYQKKNFHNQYVQNFAELGVFGFVILILMLFVNLRNGINSKDFIHISFAILIIALFLTESFLLRQRGVMFFTTMYCLFNSKNPA